MFAKLFSRITESSLMEESIETRYTFVMLLAISNERGLVVGTDVAIARRLNMPLVEFKACINRLMAPDPDSNSPTAEGRRVVRSDGERGYQLVNYLTYRAMRDETHRREYMRDYIKNYRESGKDKSRPVNPVKPPVNLVNTGKLGLAKAEAEAEAEYTRTSGVSGVQPEVRESVCDSRIVEKAAIRLQELYRRKSPLNLSEREHIASLSRRPEFVSELEELISFRHRMKPEDARFFPTLNGLLGKWDDTLDRARNHQQAKPPDMMLRQMVATAEAVLRTPTQ